MGAVSLGYGPDGKRIRRKVSGKTKQEVRAKLQALHQEVNAGVRDTHMVVRVESDARAEIYASALSAAVATSRLNGVLRERLLRAPSCFADAIRLNVRVISIWRKCSSRNASGAAVRQATGRRLNLFPSEGNQHLSLNGPHELDERIPGLRWQQSAFSHEHV